MSVTVELKQSFLSNGKCRFKAEKHVVIAIIHIDLDFEFSGQERQKDIWNLWELYDQGIIAYYIY